MISAEQELNLQGWEQWKNGSSASPWCVTVWTKQPNKQTKGFWCLLAMDRTNFSCSKFFLGQIEVHWKCTEYISMYWDTLKKKFTNPILDENWLWLWSELRKCLLPSWSPQVCFKSEDQFLISVPLSSPLSLFSSTIITTISPLDLKVLL